MYASMHLWIYTFMHPYAHMNAYIHVWIHGASASTALTWMHTYMYASMHTYMYASICPHECIHTCMHLCIYEYIHVCIHMPTWMHTYMYASTEPPRPPRWHECIHTCMNVWFDMNAQMHVCRDLYICVLGHIFCGEKGRPQQLSSSILSVISFWGGGNWFLFDVVFTLLLFYFSLYQFWSRPFFLTHLHVFFFWKIEGREDVKNNRSYDWASTLDHIFDHILWNPPISPPKT